MRDATWDDDDLDPRGPQAAEDDRSLLQRLTGQDWGDRLALGVLALIGLGIIGNALMRQTGPHPAPLFAAAVVAPTPVPVARPTDVQQTASIAQRPAEAAPTPAAPAPAAPAARGRSEIVADVQRELVRRKLYDGAVDGVTGPKTEAAIRRFETEARLAVTGEASEALLAKLKRGGPAATAAARPQAPTAPAPVPQRTAQAAPPQGPQSIADLIGQNGRPAQAQAQTQAPAPRPAPAARERSIGDLIAADTGPRRP